MRLKERHRRGSAPMSIRVWWAVLALGSMHDGPVVVFLPVCSLGGVAILVLCRSHGQLIISPPRRGGMVLENTGQVERAD